MDAGNTVRGMRPGNRGFGQIAAQYKPGESGNPSGRPKSMKEVRDICRKASPDAAHMLADFVRLRDEHGHHPEQDGRVLAVVAQTLFTWAYGKPLDYDPREDQPPIGIDTSVLTTAERQLLLGMLRKGVLKEAGTDVPQIEGQVMRE